MINDKYRNTSEKTTDALYNAMHLVIGAWQLAEEIGGHTRHGNALAGLLTMAEDLLSGAIDTHNEEWEIMKERALAEEKAA